METFYVLVPVDLATEVFSEFLLAQGAHTLDRPESFCLERNGAAVYISVQPVEPYHLEGAESTVLSMKEPPRSVVTLTVSRSVQSKPLAFEIAHRTATRWNGAILWGLDEWADQYADWTLNTFGSRDEGSLREPAS